jgi:hypothetical protein
VHAPPEPLRTLRPRTAVPLATLRDKLRFAAQPCCGPLCKKHHPLTPPHTLNASLCSSDNIGAFSMRCRKRIAPRAPPGGDALSAGSLAAPIQSRPSSRIHNFEVRFHQQLKVIKSCRQQCVAAGPGAPGGAGCRLRKQSRRAAQGEHRHYVSKAMRSLGWVLLVHGHLVLSIRHSSDDASSVSGLKSHGWCWLPGRACVFMYLALTCACGTLPPQYFLYI